MRRLALILTAGLALTACGEWKGDGTDEAIPDVAGQATGVPKSFGVLSQTYADHADKDILENRPVAYENPFEEAEHAAKPAGAKHE